MSTGPVFIGTPTELAQFIDPAGTEGITAKNVSRKILQSVEALCDTGITAVIRRSNGKRLIELRRAGSVDPAGAQDIGTGTIQVNSTNGWLNRGVEKGAG